MPLLRGFSVIDQEGGLSIPSHIRKEAGLDIADSVAIKVVRIKGSTRWPYLIAHHTKINPRFSRFEVTMMKSQGSIDDNGRLTFELDVLEQTKFEPNYRAEIKLAGPRREPWLVIRNRGSNRLTTLQKKLGRRRDGGRNMEKWQIQKWEY